MHTRLRSAYTTLFGLFFRFVTTTSSEGILNKGQPCILDNKDVDNDKEDVSMHFEYTYTPIVYAYIQTH
jgi:hypothetical protein